MAYTSHGHQVPGTPIEGGRPPIARCGGVVWCDICAKEAAYYSIQYANYIDQQLKGLKVEFTTYKRKPFEIEAIEITAENMDELAQYIGTVQTNGKDGSKFIEVDRKLIPNLWRVYVGFYLTRVGKNYRCYSKKAFRDQFELVE